MTTVAQLIAKLKEYPADAEVECLQEVTCSYDKWVEFFPVDLDDFDVLDYSSIVDRTKYPQMAGKIIIRLNAE